MALGARYRVDAKDLPGRPDIAFRSAKLAVFVDGDFWHGRDLDQRIDRLSRGQTAPYWVTKIRTNVERDRRNTALLEERGWRVLRVWETDVAKDPEAVAQTIIRARERALLKKHGLLGARAGAVSTARSGVRIVASLEREVLRRHVRVP